MRENKAYNNEPVEQVQPVYAWALGPPPFENPLQRNAKQYDGGQGLFEPALHM